MRSKVFGAVAYVFGWQPHHDPNRETAWLDGVRGVAAFLVLMSHYSMEWLTPFSDAPFGAVVLQTRNQDGVWYREQGERLWEIWRLPILRVFMSSGSAQVAVFFVLSGFVLSWGPLATIRTAGGDFDKLCRSLGSSVVRRWFRLYLPCTIVSLCYYVQRVITQYNGILAALRMFWDYVRGTEKWANPFEVTPKSQFTSGHPFNFVMWTIPFEFAGSIFVYVCLLSLGRITNFYRRVIAIIFVSLYALYSLFWGQWLFGFGLALADYVRQAGGFKKLSQKQSTFSNRMWILVFMVGLFFLGYPPPTTDWYSSPGYEWMNSVPLPPGWNPFIGTGRFWWGWGGILTVAGACHLTYVRRFFELGIIQHLGRISFMLYLIHLLGDMVISKPLRSALYDIFSQREFVEVYHGEVYVTTPWMNFWIHCVLLLATVPIVMICAHFLEVHVDRPATKFGRWVDDKLVNGFGGGNAIASALPKGEEEEQLLNAGSAAEYELREVARN